MCKLFDPRENVFVGNQIFVRYYLPTYWDLEPWYIKIITIVIRSIKWKIELIPFFVLLMKTKFKYLLILILSYLMFFFFLDNNWRIGYGMIDENVLESKEDEKENIFLISLPRYCWIYWLNNFNY